MAYKVDSMTCEPFTPEVLFRYQKLLATLGMYALVLNMRGKATHGSYSLLVVLQTSNARP